MFQFLSIKMIICLVSKHTDFSFFAHTMFIIKFWGFGKKESFVIILGQFFLFLHKKLLWVLIRSASLLLIMSTHNICFYGELEKIFPDLSSNTPSFLTLVLLNPDMPCLYGVDPGSVLFAIQYVNLYEQSNLNYLIGWQLEMGMAS